MGQRDLARAGAELHQVSHLVEPPRGSKTTFSATVFAMSGDGRFGLLGLRERARLAAGS